MASESEEQGSPHHGDFTADSPVTSSENDRFRRHPFAAQLAAVLGSQINEECLVVGLYAPWGAGKTSALRFLEAELLHRGDVVMLWFNPWRYPDEAALLKQFYDQLAAALKVELKTRGERGAGIIQKVLRLIPGSTGIAGLPVGEVANSLKKLASDHSDVTLETAKARLRNFLATQGLRVVVLIDDLDRLEADEAHAVLRLVRLNADFPRTTYVIACDDSLVAATLARRFNGDVVAGHRFLEKIVQVPLLLPRIGEAALRSFTLKDLVTVLHNLHIEQEPAEVRRFVDAFDPGLLPRITTPRAAKRYANTALFILPLTRGEVNVTDILLLEGIRLFYPSVYSRLAGNRECLLGRRGRFELRPPDQRKIEYLPQFNRLLEDLDDDERKDIEALLRVLFPYTRSLLGNVSEPDSDNDEWAIRRRVCHPDYFERHFAYGVPNGDLSDADASALVERLLAGDQVAVKSWFMNNVSADNAALFLRKIQVRLEGVRAEQVAAAAIGLAGIIGALPSESQFLLPGVQWFAIGTLGRLVSEIPGLVERHTTAECIVRETEPLTVSHDFLMLLQGDSKNPVLSVEALDQLNTLLLNRIRAAAQSGELQSQNGLRGLLWRWKEADGSAKVTEWAKEAAVMDPSLIDRLLSAYAGSSTAIEEDRDSRPNFSSNSYDQLTRVIDVAMLDTLVRERFGADLAELNDTHYGARGLSDERFLAAQYLHQRRKHQGDDANGGLSDVAEQP